MSSILKALKKVENDRATRQPDALKIDSDILRPDTPSGHSTAGIIAAAFLLIAGGAATTYLFTGRTVSPEKKAATAQFPASAPQLPAQPSAKIPLETLPPAILVVPAQSSRSERMPPHTPKTSKRAQAGRDTSANRQRSAVHSTSATPAATAVPETAPRPALRVNGIAWQNSSADSMAIINGTAVSNGKVIEGVEVEEIQKDRVRFNYRGEKFEIPLGQSNR